MRLVTALVAGVLAALLVAGFPASAATDHPIAAQNFSWNPPSVSILPGDSVTWSNSTGTAHNVCVAKPGDPSPTTNASTCTEFRNGDPLISWAGYTNSHVFNTEGTYHFICQAHPGSMTGTITVGSGGGTTTTTTTTDTTTTQTQTQTSTTQTQTQTESTQTQTQTQTTAADTTAPAFTGKLKRRSSRKALILELGSSEDAGLTATVFRRPPGKRAFARVGKASVDVNAGRNVVTLPRRAAGKLRAGAYKVKLQLEDATGNRSAPRTLQFKLA